MFAAGRSTVRTAKDSEDEDTAWLQIGQSFQSHRNTSEISNSEALQVYKRRDTKAIKKRKKKKKKHDSEKKRKHEFTSSDESEPDRRKRKSREVEMRKRRLRQSVEESEMILSDSSNEDNHQLANIQATVDNSRLFQVDSVGDSENAMYGSLIVEVQPRYHLATRRSIITGERLDLPPRSQLLKQLSDDPTKKEEQLPRYFTANRQRYTSRLRMAYSQKRMGRHREREYTEISFMPLDPIVTGELDDDIEDGGTSSLLRTDLENVESYLVQKTKELNEQIKSDPTNCDAWLDLIAFQSQAQRLMDVTSDQKARRGAETKAINVVMEKKQRVLMKALEAIPESQVLQRLELQMLLWQSKQDKKFEFDDDSDVMMERFLEERLENNPTNGDLWLKLVELHQRKFSTFSMPMIRNVYARVITILNQERMRMIATDAQSDSFSSSDVISSQLLGFYHRLIECECKAGYVERAIVHLQSLLEYNRIVQSLETSLSFKETLEMFTARWNQEFPRFGEDEGMGLMDCSSISCDFSIHFQNICGSEHKQDQTEKSQETFADNTTPDPSHEREGKWIYSSLHGYRIWVDGDESVTNETAEYERILSELRGTEASQMRQIARQVRQERKQAKAIEEQNRMRDERMDYPPFSSEADPYVKWLIEEKQAEYSQWQPLRSTNRHHTTALEIQPDRAMLTEELVPFLFRVPRLSERDVILLLLHTMGVRPYCTPQSSMYVDDWNDYTVLTRPILDALNPELTTTMRLSTQERIALLSSAVLDDVVVLSQSIRDGTRAQFIRNVFTQALSQTSEDCADTKQYLMMLWINYETQLVLYHKDKTAEAQARQLCQRLLQNTSTSGCIDTLLMYAYAKMELLIGNHRQVIRICNKTLETIQGTENAWDLHRLVFLRVRIELWSSSVETNQLVRLRVLWILWQLQRASHAPFESLESFLKPYRKLSSDQVKILLAQQIEPHIHEILDYYRLQFKRVQALTVIEPFVSTPFVLHNWCVAIFVVNGFSAAQQAWQQYLTSIKSHQPLGWWMYLEFVQRYDVVASVTHCPRLIPKIWRSAVQHAVRANPLDPLSLRLFVDAESNRSMSQTLRKYIFERREEQWQRYMQPLSVVEWLFALLSELSRASFQNQVSMYRVRRVFEDATPCALAARLYLRFEVAMGKIKSARKLWYQNLTRFPWSKALYEDGIEVLRPYLTESECRELLGFLQAKELHVRIDTL